MVRTAVFGTVYRGSNPCTRAMKISDHKKTKMGHVPGDVSIQFKAAMLEGKVDPSDARRARGYKKDHIRKANRRMRHQPIEI